MAPDSQYRILTCISVATNALAAGGIFMFPVISPALESILKLTQPQLTTVALAGIIGQYPLSPLVGKILDIYGPSICSLISAVLFFAAFMSSSLELTMAPADVSESSKSSFYRLTLFFFMAGLGTVSSIFSSIFAASNSFPHHSGIATGCSMALFGLSPYFLSVVASNFFTEPTSGLLEVVPFLKFMAVLTATTHTLGVFAFRSSSSGNKIKLSNEQERGQADENSRLIPQTPGNNPTRPFPNPIRDQNFWLLALCSLCSIGACEMVISNMGTIVVSLPPDPASNTTSDFVTSNQVKILSISNTISRLLVGPLADFVSPVASYLPTGATLYPRKHRVSRVVFISGSALVLVVAFLWMEVGVKSQEAVWALSVGTGITYGAIFTVLPGIVSSVWGLPNLGRNFGIITYAPFVGTPMFSYLYAFVSSSNTRDTNICEGTICWRVTFWVTCGTSAVAFLCSLVLWKRWRGRV